MRFSQLRGQKLSTLVVMRFMVCQNCALVDDNSERMRKGYPCPVCETPSAGGLPYFPRSIREILDMMQSAFHCGLTTPPFVDSTEETPTQTADGSRLATIIYFSTLNDLLLEHFLREIASARDVPYTLVEYMLRETPYTRGRVEKLFPLLTQIKFSKAVTLISNKKQKDYATIVTLARDTNTKRNDLLHAGDKWAIAAGLPEECIDRSPEIFELFASLHNEFVHPIYFNSATPYLRLPAGPNADE